MTIHKCTITSRDRPPVGGKIKLIKDPTNAYDDEAIKVMVAGKHDGYVSALYKTRRVGTISAGRLLDKIEDGVEATYVGDGIAEVEGK